MCVDEAGVSYCVYGQRSAGAADGPAGRDTSTTWPAVCCVSRVACCVLHAAYGLLRRCHRHSTFDPQHYNRARQMTSQSIRGRRRCRSRCTHAMRGASTHTQPCMHAHARTHYAHARTHYAHARTHIRGRTNTHIRAHAQTHAATRSVQAARTTRGLRPSHNGSGGSPELPTRSTIKMNKTNSTEIDGEL